MRKLSIKVWQDKVSGLWIAEPDGLLAHELPVGWRVECERLGDLIPRARKAICEALNFTDMDDRPRDKAYNIGRPSLRLHE